MGLYENREDIIWEGREAGVGRVCCWGISVEISWRARFAGRWSDSTADTLVTGFEDFSSGLVLRFPTRLAFSL